MQTIATPEQDPILIPVDIEQYLDELKANREYITRVTQMADAWLFNYFGLDALIGLLPVVGALYTLGTSVYLFNKSVKFRLGSSKLLWFGSIALADSLVSAVPITGDVLDLFIRVHAWHGNALIAHMDEQILAILKAKKLAEDGQVPDFDSLRKYLFG
jgi:hypothetical protein